MNNSNSGNIKQQLQSGALKEPQMYYLEEYPVKPDSNSKIAGLQNIFNRILTKVLYPTLTSPNRQKIVKKLIKQGEVKANQSINQTKANRPIMLNNASKGGFKLLNPFNFKGVRIEDSKRNAQILQSNLIQQQTQQQYQQQPKNQYQYTQQQHQNFSPNQKFLSLNINHKQIRATTMKNNQILFNINHGPASIPSKLDASQRGPDQNIFLIAKRINCNKLDSRSSQNAQISAGNTQKRVSSAFNNEKLQDNIQQSDQIQNIKITPKNLNQQTVNNKVSFQNQNFTSTNSSILMTNTNNEGRNQQQNIVSTNLPLKLQQSQEKKDYRLSKSRDSGDHKTQNSSQIYTNNTQASQITSQNHNTINQNMSQNSTTNGLVPVYNINYNNNNNQQISSSSYLNFQTFEQKILSQLQNQYQQFHLNHTFIPLVGQQSQQAPVFTNSSGIIHLNNLNGNYQTSQMLKQQQNQLAQQQQITHQQQMYQQQIMQNQFTQQQQQQFIQNIFNQTTDIKEMNKIKKKDPAVYQIQYNNCYKYWSSIGNNGELIKRVLDTREWWQDNVQPTSSLSFKWVCTSNQVRFEKLSKSSIKQCVNFFEGHKEITTKSCLIKNLKMFCETHKINLFDITPVTFLLDLNDETSEFQIGKFASFFLKNHPSRQKEKSDNSIKKQIFELKKRLKPIMSNVVSEKSQKSNPFSKPKMHPTFVGEQGKYLWLLKPTGLNRGRGIQIFNDLDQFEKFLFEFVNDKDTIQSPSKEKENSKQIKDKDKDKEKNLTIQNEKKQTENEANQQTEEQTNPQEEKQFNTFIKTYSFVIQKYIEQPFLINKRKFDIRVWTLVTQNQEIFYFQRGYIRTSCEEYNIDSKDLYVHLTNNAVQRYCDNYGQFEDGNCISFDTFHDMMKEKNPEYDFLGDIVPQIKQQCLMSVTSVKKKLNPEDRKYCFQIFGYDYFIDSNFNLWLIECNCNPCLEETSPYLQMIIPRMVDDAFRLTIDQLYPKKSPQATKLVYQSTYEKQFQQNQQEELQKSQFIDKDENNKNNHDVIEEQVQEEMQQEESEITEQNRRKNNFNSSEHKQQHYQQLTNNQILIDYGVNQQFNLQQEQGILHSEQLEQNLNSSAQELNQMKENDLKQDDLEKDLLSQSIQEDNLKEEINNNKMNLGTYTSLPQQQQPQTQQNKNNNNKRKQHFPVKGFDDDENMWELIGSFKNTNQTYPNLKKIKLQKQQQQQKGSEVQIEQNNNLSKQ